VAYLLAALGGALGALARWGVVLALPRSSGEWPWATLAVNLSGCLLIGVLIAVLAARRPDDDHLRTFLGAGVLGGFTTFSAFAVEVADLLRAGTAVVAATYVAVSVLGGLLAVAVGLRIGALAGGERA
jgi:fluoride exporter